MRIFCPAMVASVSFSRCRASPSSPSACRQAPGPRACVTGPPTPAVGRVARPDQAPPFTAGWSKAPESSPGTVRGWPTEVSHPATDNLFSMPYWRTATKSGCVGSLQDLGDPTRADGTATLADREAEAFLHRDRLDELYGH